MPLASFTTWESSYNAIVYIQNFSNFPQRISFFYATLEKNNILSRLATDEILRKGRVIMYDSSGRILLDSSSGNTENEKNKMISIGMTGAKRGIRVTVDIPRHVISDRLAPFRNIALIFAIVIIITGIFLSFILAQRSAIPVRKIMEEAVNSGNNESMEEMPDNYKDDFAYIQHFIAQTKWDYETFENKRKQQEDLQREISLVQLLYGLAYSPEILESVRNNLSDMPKKFRIAAISMPDIKESAFTTQTVRQTMVRDFIKSRIQPDGYIHFTGNIIVLFLSDGENDNPAESLGKLSIDLHEKIKITGRIALSEPIEDIQETYKAFYQVRSLLRLPRNSGEGKILQKADSSSQLLPAEFLDASRFYELLLHAEEDSAVDYINRMLNEFSGREYTDENDIQQMFFIYRRICIQVVNDLDLKMEKETLIPSYDAYQDIGILFGGMKEAIKNICAAVKTRHEKQNTEFERSVIKFVDDNITNQGLFTKLATGNFNITEHQLQEIFRRRTGKSFLEYVESKRLILAREILLTTNKSINRIYKECGYSTENAFYKAFKRHYKKAPSQIRH